MKFEKLPKEIIKECFPNFNNQVKEGEEWPFNYIIDDEEYAIYTFDEAEEMMEEDARNSLDNLLYDVPDHLVDYIDTEGWVRDNMYYDFENWLDDNFYPVLDCSPSKSAILIYKKSK